MYMYMYPCICRNWLGKTLPVFTACCEVKNHESCKDLNIQICTILHNYYMLLYEKLHRISSAPVASLPPRMTHSSTSTYEATPSSGSSALLTRPSSAGNLHAKAATSPPIMQVNPSKPGISPIRYPSQQERVQVKRGPSSSGGSKLTCKCMGVICLLISKYCTLILVYKLCSIHVDSSCVLHKGV